jgi:hypothetical protein
MDGRPGLWHSPRVPKDPRNRPYRIALWTIYLTVIAVVSTVVLTSIVRNLRGPHRPPASAALPTRATIRVCLTELEALNREQNVRAFRLGEEIGEEDAIPHWQAWSREWEQRVDDLGERCHLDAEGQRDGREEVARAREAVLALHRAYRAQVNRFAQEEAELARGASRALRDAREAVARAAASP